MGSVAVLKEFAMTEKQEVENVIIESMMQFNFPHHHVEIACCQMHAASHYVAESLSRHPCIPWWRVHRDWQCHMCTMMHQDDENICEVCLEDRISQNGPAE